MARPFATDVGGDGGGQVAEIRQHVDNHLGYLSFWRELEAAAGPTEAEVEPEPLRPKGFARFFR